MTKKIEYGKIVKNAITNYLTLCLDIQNVIKTSPEVVVIKFLHFIYSFVHRDRAASARGW